MTTLKDCLTKLQNKEDVMTDLYYGEKNLLRLQLFTAFQIFKDNIEELHSAKPIEDLSCEVYFIKGDEGPGSFEIGFIAERGDAPDEVWKNIYKKEALINDALSYIRMPNYKDYGKIVNTPLRFSITEGELPDLAEYFLSRENRAIYEATILEMKLSEKNEVVSKKMKL